MPTNLTGSNINVTYNQLLHVDGGPAAGEKTVYGGTGTPTALKLGTVSASIENIQFNGNTISTLDTNGALILAPNGSGAVSISKVAIAGGSIINITDLAIADGGTGASDAAGARTNLGLGTLALQDANAVNITGGTITNAVFTGSVSVTTLTATTVNGTTVNGGNLRLQGNILSSVDTDGDITLQPNGAGRVIMSTFAASSFATNNLASGVTLSGTTLEASGTDPDISISITPKGTGAVLIPLLDTNVAAAGVTLAGTTLAADGTDADIDINITPKGTGSVVAPTVKALVVDTNVAAAGVTLAGTTLAADGTDADISINITPKGTGSVVVSKADINGGTVDATTVGATTPAAVTGTNVLATASVGYATGAGGTITQITSKSTGVTLDKLVGQIVTHDESLASNTGASFTVTNSLVGANDVIVVHRASGGTASQYAVRVDSVAAGSFVVTVINGSGGALAEALTLNFAVIKGVVA